MRKTYFILTLIILLMPVLALGQGLNELEFGYNAAGPDGKLTATSGVGVASNLSPMGVFINPAQIQTEKVLFSMSVSGFRLEERRAFPVYDRFDGVVTKGTYVVNDYTYADPWFIIGTGLLPKFSFSLYHRPFKSFEYDYTEQVRDNIFGDFVIAENVIKGKGMIKLTGVNIAYQINSNLSVGVNAGISNKVTMELNKESTWIDSTNAFYFERTKRQMKDRFMRFQLGGKYMVNERWTVGLSAILPSEVTFTSNSAFEIPSEPGGEVQDEISYSYPLELVGGFQYLAQTPFRTRLMMDYRYAFWSNTELKSGSSTISNFDDIYSVGTAVELTYLHNNTFTFSYVYTSSPWDKSLHNSKIGVGFGFPVPNGKIDAGFGFAKRSYREMDLFSDSWFGGDRTNSLIDDVEENFLYGSISIQVFLK